jgi:hypothetical protein
MLSYRLRRADRWTFTFAALSAVAFVGLLVYGRGMTFLFDEWSFIDGRVPWDLNVFLRLHNEHWPATHVLIHKILMEIVGLTTYLPYQAAVLALHVATAAALFAWVKRESGPVLAVGAGSLFLFFGRGSEDLFWAAEIGWNAAMAFGAWALMLAMFTPRSWWPVASAILLVLSVASSSVGLAFVAATALALVVRGDWRRLWVVVPASLAFGLWFLLFGRQSLQLTPARNSNLSEWPRYLGTAVASAFGSISGWGAVGGAPLAVVVAIATAARAISSRPMRLGVIVGLLGGIGMLGLVTLGRTGLPISIASASHYMYTAAFFLIGAMSAWLADLGFDPRRRRALITFGLIVAVALGSNLIAMRDGRNHLVAQSTQVRATVAMILQHGGSPALPDTKGQFPIPGRTRLEQLVARYGSPVTDPLAGVGEPTAAALDSALFDLVGEQFVARAAPLAVVVVAPTVVSSSAVEIVADGGCLLVRPIGPSPSLVVAVTSGEALYIEGTNAPGQAQAFLAKYAQAFETDKPLAVVLSTESATAVIVPDLGAGEGWHVRIDPATPQWRACVGSVPSAT